MTPTSSRALMNGASNPTDMTPRMLIVYLPAARKKARDAAVAEVLTLLHDLGPAASPGGPLSEQGGIVWITLPDENIEKATERFPRLGYTKAVDLLVPEGLDPDPRGAATGQLVRWKRRDYSLVRLYQENPAELRALDPDRRVFLFETGDGQVRPIQGYRGSRDPLTHRALPARDARLLVNLVADATPGKLLEPFAGAGGIVLPARAAGWGVISADVDPAVRHGLAEYGATHLVADARQLPLEAETIDAIATEPPYDECVGDLVEESLVEMYRVLRPDGRVAMLCAAWQASGLRARARELGMEPTLDIPINRKGLDVVLLTWRR